MPKNRKWDRLIHDTGYEDVKVSLQQIPEWIETVKAGAANLLPLPSLDGGHIVLAVLECLTGISMDRIRPVLKKIAVLVIMGSAIRIILSGSG